MERPDIVGIGLSTLDVLVRLREMPTWERPGAPSEFALDGGGPVATACAAAARLGARAGYIGTAGDDEAAELKLRSLCANGVDVSRVVRRPGAEPHVIVVYVNEENGERAFAPVRRPPHAPLRPDELDREYITSARCLHLDGFEHEAALAAAGWVRAAGGIVSLDCARTDGASAGARVRELVSCVDVLICGSGFGRSLTGEADIWEAGAAVLDLGPRVFVQTEGEQGCYTVTREERFHTPAFAVDVVDTTGAGDVFHGAYLVGMLKGWDARVTARFASAVAAISCTGLGGRRPIPRFDEVRSFLESRGLALPAGAR